MHVALKSKTEDLPVITLAGPPNSGKTSLFNCLSGEKTKSVNYPGSTVECKESKLLKKFKLNAVLIDSPGIVSLFPNSPEEKIAVSYLLEHPKFGFPDLVILTIDVSQLSRHLLLAKQLKLTGVDLIIAITMNDVLKEKGFDICVEKLKESLGCEIVKIDGRYGIGTDELINEVKLHLKNKKRNEENKIKDISSSKQELLNIFKEIEEITNNVIYETGIQDNSIPENVKRANAELTIKNNQTSGIRLEPDERTIKIDKFILHKYWGILIFILIMSFTFTAIFWLASPLMDFVDKSFSYLSDYAKSNLSPGIFRDLLTDGIISGTGAVLIFFPQIIILFFILGFLEDTGYLARGAMLIDKPLSKIGLNGRSFVPMLSGFACAIPAIMATRTIQNKKERLLTIFIIPLISCSARLPVYTLLIAFLFFRKPLYSGLALTLIYLFSITTSLIVAGIINRFQSKILKIEDNTSFIMELPAYRKPQLKVIFNNTFHNLNQYLKKAGPVILIFSLFLWLLTYFPDVKPDTSKFNNLTEKEISGIESSIRLENSYASKIGKIIEPVMKPLGMDWRIGVSLIATFAAREVFVSSLALIFKVTAEEEDLRSSLLVAMKNAKFEGTNKNLFTPATIIGLIVFFIFALQCISTIAISKKESGSWRIPVLQVIFYSSVAYIFSFLTVNILRLFGL